MEILTDASNFDICFRTPDNNTVSIILSHYPPHSPNMYVYFKIYSGTESLTYCQWGLLDIKTDFNLKSVSIF